ncbi:hypothetical protein T02_9391 [Trichinella nativa]|uniref:Uncharacterized protein n=1 Tax=Trichinella nativa TaxID=6335 RepID=A0A0V1LQI3_9BILA|nr:hypothetical protein T02_9391 [Trichinella nativa]
MKQQPHPSCRKPRLGELQRQSLRLSKRCGISNPNIADPVEDVLRTFYQNYDYAKKTEEGSCPNCAVDLSRRFTSDSGKCGTKWIDWKNDSNNKSASISSDSATASLLNVYQKELQRRQEAAHIAQ